MCSHMTYCKESRINVDAIYPTLPYLLQIILAGFTNKKEELCQKGLLIDFFRSYFHHGVKKEYSVVCRGSAANIRVSIRRKSKIFTFFYLKDINKKN